MSRLRGKGALSDSKKLVILDYIRDYWLRNYKAPTLNDVRENLGFSSLSTAYYWIQILKGEGKVIYEEGSGRTLRLPDMVITFKEGVQDVTNSSQGNL
jgi:hypothetical protein